MASSGKSESLGATPTLGQTERQEQERESQMSDSKDQMDRLTGL